jgi:hypothetical protein
VAAVTRPKVERFRPGELIELARQGRLRIPRFQRPFRWQVEDVLALFDSVVRSYPIGNLLFWRRPAAADSVEIGPLTIDAPKMEEALWVVDGQQRVTSLIGALTAPAGTTDPRFRVFFDLRRKKFVSANRRQVVPDHLVPVTEAADNRAALAWSRGRDLPQDQQDALDELVTQLRDFEIPTYTVTSDDEHALREIFDRLNTFGKRLTRAEVFNALHAIEPEHEPSDLRSLGASVRGLQFGEFNEQLLLHCVMALRGGDIARDFRNAFADDSDRHAAFRDVDMVLRHVVTFLRDDIGVPHVRLLPYALVVPVLTRFVALFRPPVDLSAELLSRWFWRGAASGVQVDGFTVALRKSVNAVRDDPVASARRLLELIRPMRDNWVPDLTQTASGRSAMARLNLLALAARRPRLIVSNDETQIGDVVDLAGIVDEGQRPYLKIVQKTADSTEMADTLANRLVHPPVDADVAAVLTSGLEREMLTSQLVDDECVALLGAGDTSAFLQRRSKLVSDAIAAYVLRNAKWGFRDGPPVAPLFGGHDGHDGHGDIADTG